MGQIQQQKKTALTSPGSNRQLNKKSVQKMESLNNFNNKNIIDASIKEKIDDNIEDIKERVEKQAKAIKTLLREALAHYRSQGIRTENSLSPTRLKPDDFQRMDEEMSDHRRVIDQYMTEL